MTNLRLYRSVIGSKHRVEDLHVMAADQTIGHLSLCVGVNIADRINVLLNSFGHIDLGLEQFAVSRLKRFTDHAAIRCDLFLERVLFGCPD